MLRAFHRPVNDELPERHDPCPSCGSTDTFVYVDPKEGPELVCVECIRWEIASDAA